MNMTVTYKPSLPSPSPNYGDDRLSKGIAYPLMVLVSLSLWYAIWFAIGACL